jgi:hypothetical protein
MGIEVFLKHHQRRVLFYRIFSPEMDPGFSYGPHTSTPAAKRCRSTTRIGSYPPDQPN